MGTDHNAAATAERPLPIANDKPAKVVDPPAPAIQGSGWELRIFTPQFCLLLFILILPTYYIASLVQGIHEAKEDLLAKDRENSPRWAIVVMPRWDGDVTKQVGHHAFPADGRVHVSFERFWASAGTEVYEQQWGWHQKYAAAVWESMQACSAKYDPENALRRASEWKRKTRQGQEAEHSHCLCLSEREGPWYDAKTDLYWRTAPIYCDAPGGGHHVQPFATWERELLERQRQSGNPYPLSLVKPLRVPSGS